MEVFPKKYSKKGPISLEDYVIYMSERIEYFAHLMEKRILELEKRGDVDSREITRLKDELLILKELLEG